MKILGVRFMNLNSLVGEWHIDFTRPEYASNGIFAITGPTGAGKTTIMDAICLGLYGSTPRLGRVAKSSNEIMSRQTGECSAEVTFETRKGRFRCTWSQHRARKRIDGELQQARHEVCDADSGEILESRMAQTSEFIENATGMDFERFTRSMLLAQGGFAAFLQAPPGERSPILEQITGTEIYSRISIKVHERLTEERNKLDLLKTELKGIQPLSEEEERDLKATLAEKQGEESETAGKMADLNRALAWLEGLAALEKEMVALDAQRKGWEMRKSSFEPEARKLEKAFSALGLDPEYGSVKRFRTDQANEAKELNNAVTARPEKEKALADALAARQATEALLNEARLRQASEGETIKKVREFDARLGEQKKQLDEKDRVISGLEGQVKTYQGRIEDDGKALAKTRTALDAVLSFRSAHAADAALPTQFTAIERGLEALRDLAAKQAGIHDEITAAAGRKESARMACRELETDHEKIGRELSQGKEALAGLGEEITAILQARDMGQWRSDAETLKDRERLLMQVSEMLDRIAKHGAALDGLVKTLDTLNAGWKKFSDGIKASADKKTLLDKDITGLEAQVSLLHRIRGLEEQRIRLEDGKPCPLCGALEHPYAEGNIPLMDEAEAELKKAKQAFKAASEELGRLEAGQVKAATDIQHTEKEIREKQGALDSDEKLCAETLSRLQMDAAPEARAAKVQEELAQIRLNIAGITALMAAAEEKAKREKAAQQALEKTRIRWDRSGKAVQAAMLALETAVLEHGQRIKTAADLADETARARAAALRDMEPFGITLGPETDITDVSKSLKERKTAWEAAEEKKSSHEKKMAELGAAVEKNQALLSSLGEDLKARTGDRDTVKLGHDALLGSRRELFGEKIADMEEERLAGSVKKAEQDCEKARDDHGQKDRDMSALLEKIALLTEKTERQALELAAAEQAFQERLKAAGFPDEADYLSARLREEDRAVLKGREEALNREKMELDTRQQDKAKAIADEREKKLTDQSGEGIKEKAGGLEAKLQQLRLDMGGIVKTLRESEALKEKQRERLMEMEAQKREHTRWNELHLLIGSADGKKFRNFAQGLTFEVMTAYANRQLRKMTDRYLLVHDPSQPLELYVIDNYQAGEIRSTKNLSGGESFIVSLALALGLSQMASRNVRVDSLFLDEGFGTLDEDALETALETLAGLHQDGKLIGVISHVSALKDRISTQIQVIPRTGGRSLLQGPGCRRIMAP